MESHGRGELEKADAQALLGDMLRMPILIVPVHEVLDAALEIALQTNRTVDDNLYLATAVRRKAKLLTADLRMVNALIH